MRYIEARIIYVDTNRNVLDAISIDGLNWFEDIRYTNTGLKQSGDLYHPEIGDICICDLHEDGQVEFIKFYSARRYDDNGLVQSIIGKKNIGTELPGDRILTGPDGAILKLLRGGYAAIGASPLAQTIYLALEGLIRTVAQNYEVISSGSRLYSINDGGKILTRFCFNTSEKFFATGAMANEGYEAENFEYQIEIGEAGFVIMAGEIGDDGKRVNNITVRIERSGDLRMSIGDNMTFDMYSNGCLELNIKDNDNNSIYTNTIGFNSDVNKVLLKEIIKGDIIREVDGDVKETVTGSRTIFADSLDLNGTIVSTNSTLTVNSTNINIDQIENAPSAGLTIP